MRAFVNYRTKDEGSTALLISRYLSERIGEQNVFLDKKSIDPGTLFDDELLRSVWRSDVLVSIMGVDWLDFQGPNGRAIDDPEDWVHKELYEALTHQVLVVPLLVDGAEFPKKHRLPERLAELARRQYVIFDLRLPEAGFARLDRVLDLPDADEPPKTAGQSGGIGSVRGNGNINVTDPRGSMYFGDQFARPRDDS
jgi:TIR domain